MACLATVALLFLLCGGVESQETVSKSRSAERTYVYRSTTRLADQNDFTLNGKFQVLCLAQKDESKLCELKVKEIQLRSPKVKGVPVQYGGVGGTKGGADLSKRFLFRELQSGQISDVYHPSDENSDALLMKKAFVSSISASLKPSLQYFVEETDHAGKHVASYEILGRTKEGVKYRKTKKPEDNDEYETWHQKDIHYSNEKEAVVYVVVNDTIRLLSSDTDESMDSRHGERYNYTERQPEVHSGEFPNFHSGSNATVDLVSLTSVNVKPTDFNLKGLVRGDIQAEASNKKMPPKDYQDRIEMAIDCMVEKNSAESPDYRLCYGRLMDTLARLPTSRLSAVTDQYLSSKLLLRPSQRTQAYLEGLVGAASVEPLAQQFILQKVLLAKVVPEEFFRKTLILLFSLRSPSLELINTVRDLAFRPERSPKNLRSPMMINTATLLYGSLGREVAKTNKTLSEIIAAELENKLKASGVPLERVTRSNDENLLEEEWRDRHYDQMMFVHSIGNAGADRSRPLLTYHLNGTKVPSILRRAAAHALGQYKCDQSADALLSSLSFEEEESVWEEAFRSYYHHPLRNNVTLAKHLSERIIRGTGFKRRSIEDFLKKLDFKLELPPLDWKKQVGSSSLGASFGVYMRNQMELKTESLITKFETIIRNEGWITGHLGIIGFNYDVVRAKACYHGHVTYDLNFLKDFDIDKYRNLVNEFENIVGSVAGKIQKAIEAFKKIVCKGCLEGIFQNFIDVLVDVPQLLRNVQQVVGDVQRQLAEFVDVPFVARAQDVLRRAKTLIDNIQSDFLSTLKDINDVITIDLPYAASVIQDTFDFVGQAIGQLFKSPTQSISQISKGQEKVKGALAVILSTKEKLSNILKLGKGKAPLWLNFVEEWKSIWTDAVAVYDEAKATLADRAAKAKKFFSDAFDPESQELFVAQTVEKLFKGVFNPLEALGNLSAPFLNAYDSVLDVIVSVKEAYTDFKDYIADGKSLLLQVFGPKFHTKFLKTRRPCESDPCGCGVFPATGGGRFEEGLDLVAAKGEEIFSPISGTAVRSADNQIEIVGNDGGFSGKTVIIDDIDVDPKFAKKRSVTAGDPIGKATTTAFCNLNAIHITVKETGDGSVIDPSPFLSSLTVPQLKWIQECDEYSLVVVGVTISSGRLSDAVKRFVNDIRRGKNPFDGLGEKLRDAVKTVGSKIKNGYKELKKAAGDAINKIKDSFGGDKLQKALESGFSFDDIDLPSLDLGSFEVDFGTALSDLNLKLPKLQTLGSLLNFDIGGSTIQSMLDSLKSANLDEASSALNGLLQNLAAAIENPLSTCQNPQTMSTEQLQAAVEKQNRPTSGSRETLLKRLLKVPNTVCSYLKEAIPSNTGHYCTIASDCLEISCCLQVKLFRWTKQINAAARFDKCKSVVEISFAGWKKEYDISKSFEKTVSADDVFGVGISVSLSLKVLANSTTIVVTLGGEVCSDKLGACTPKSWLLKDIVFDIAAAECKPNKRSVDLAAVVEKLRKLPVTEIQKKLASFNINGTVTSLLSQSSKAVLEKLRSKIVSALGTFAEEFPKIVDFCKSGSLDFPPVSRTFFYHSVTYPIGPVFVTFFIGSRGAYGTSLTFEACFLKMEGNVRVVPWAGLVVYGGARLTIFIFAVELSIHGHIIDTSFPAQLSIRFNKMPLNVNGRMDLVLVPLRVEIWAAVKIEIKICLWGCFTISKTIWSSRLWSYQAPAITTNIFTIGNVDHDYSPPSYSPLSNIDFDFDHARRRRSLSDETCRVGQLRGLFPNEPQFALETAATDDESDVKFSFSVGTYRGGKNVKSGVDMGGPKLVSSEYALPSGIPLYFTVTARNSEGLTADSRCSIPTYDTTLPSGRVEQSFDVSTNPFILSAFFVAHDDSVLKDSGRASIGLGTGSSNVVPWHDFSYDSISVNADARDDLQHFASPRIGLLSTVPVAETTVLGPQFCASFCLSHTVQCVSFDYDYDERKCRVQKTIEGPDAELRVLKSFHNFERIGVGHSAWLEYKNLSLEHGKVYTMNTRIENVLDYSQLISSKGTLIDLTPPDTALILNAKYNNTMADGCVASIKQKSCTEVTPWPNHRILVDGEGSLAVFNGHIPFEDKLYTRYNNFISGNFRGFYDNEAGIFAYTWAAGKSVLSQDVVSYRDPHTHLPDPLHWTNAPVELVHLDDGKYYLTVQAVNDVGSGGSLVTTVGHGTPLLVDTVPPLVHGIRGLHFNETTTLLTLYYNVSDSGSGVNEVDFGVGKTIHDNDLLHWTRYGHGEKSQLRVYFKIPDGVPAWVRLRAIDRVYLMTTGHADRAILLDHTPPIAGFVYDGKNRGFDVVFTAESNQFCFNWDKFHDADSGIASVAFAGVGSSRGSFDVVARKAVAYYQKSVCFPVQLQHNAKYFATLEVSNGASKPLTVTSSSDGVLVDTTPARGGSVRDGSIPGVDWEYSYEEAAVYSNWDGFFDNESSIARYEVQSSISGKQLPVQSVDSSSRTHADVSAHLQHGDRILSIISAVNGAGVKTTLTTDGYVIDTTPPELLVIRYADALAGLPFYQSTSDSVKAVWSYRDPESGMKSYRVAVHEIKFGSSFTVYPLVGDWIDFAKQGKDGDLNTYLQRGLSLTNGARYVVKVMAINNAELSVIHSTETVTIDTSPPVMRYVVVGTLDPKEDEDIDSSGRIVHAGQSSMSAAWLGGDPDSGIASYLVAIGTKPGTSDVSNGWRDMGPHTNGVIDGLAMDLTDPKTGAPVYYMSVKSRNRARLESAPVVSKPILIVKADVTGVTTDGETTVDVDYQRHNNAITAQFNGYESERCGGMAGYVWAIGSGPSLTDVQPFTTEGLVVYRNGSGAAQMPINLDNGETVFCTIKATTKCGNHLQSSSNGITIDIKNPTLSFVGNDSTSPYQRSEDSLGLSWYGNDSESGIREYVWSAGSHLFSADFVSATKTVEMSTPPGIVKNVSQGVPTFFSVLAVDNSGHETKLTNPGVAVDSSPPLVGDLRCPSALSTAVESVQCCWDPFRDAESDISHFTLMMGDLPGSWKNGGPLTVSSTELCAELDLSFTVNESRNKTFVVTVEARNGAGLKASSSQLLTIDSTPPVGGSVDIVRDFYVKSGNREAVKCQQSEVEIYVSWDGFTDSESSLTEYEVGIGTSKGSADVYPFTSVGLETNVAIRRIFMPHGSRIFASVRATNAARLSVTATSDPVAISSAPRVTVVDGLGNGDVDFQSSSQILSARWSVDDSCPVSSLSWAIYRVDGHQILPSTPLTSSSTSAIRENLRLDSGEVYYVIVAMTNAIGKTAYGRSDGVIVDVEGPIPGQVFDGTDEGIDSNYQPSVKILGANWEKFGEPSSTSPGQQVVCYEVALGTDDRYYLTRQNVVPFVDVGLNRSVIFDNLELTPKTQKYFFTVRATSQTGVTAESTSNGVYVGFGDSPLSGLVETTPFTNSSSTISATWEGFSSSLPLLFYEWAISTRPPSQIDCPTSISDRRTNDSEGIFVQDFVSVGLDTIASNNRLTLLHNQRYFVIVRATNDALKCASVVSNPVLIDLTPPSVVTVGVGYDNGLNVRYATSSDSLEAYWNGIDDKESGISKYEIGLFKESSCTGRQNVNSNQLDKIQEFLELSNGTSYTYTGLAMRPNEPYFVFVVAHNRAGSRSLSKSTPILLDSSAPNAGDVKDGVDWSEDAFFQSSVSEMSGVLTVARSEKDMICPYRVFNFSRLHQLPLDWRKFDPNRLKDIDMHDSVIYDSNQVDVAEKHLNIGFVRDRGLTKVRSSLIYTDFRIYDGASIDITMSAARGKNVVTPVVIWDGPQGSLGDFELQNPVRDSSQAIEEVFISSSGSGSGSGPTQASSNSTDAPPPEEEEEEQESFSAASASLGFHIYGESLFADDVWYLAYWCRFARDEDEPKIQWLELDFDPTIERHQYTLKFFTQQVEGDSEPVAELFVDGSLRGVLTGIPTLSLKARLTLGVRTRFGYVPPLPNPFAPPSAVASISRIKLPSAEAEACHFGSSFYDLRSHIVSLDACVATTRDGDACDVAPYTHLALPCTPCVDSCDAYDCEADCSTDSKLAVIPFTLRNLPLSAGAMKVDDQNDEGDFVAPSQYFDPSAYYVRVRVQNGAGATSVSTSSGIVIDTTPPNCSELHQVDTAWSMTEPTLFQGVYDSLGAFWECVDNISGIVDYSWTVFVQNTSDVVARGVLPSTEKSIVVRNVTLKQKGVYAFVFVARNGAGLTSTWSGAGITVDTERPDLRNASFDVLPDDDTKQIKSLTVPFRKRKNSKIGFAWKGLDDDDIATVDMSIGFSHEGQDVLPQVQVSYGTNGSHAVIRDGQLFVGRGAGQNLSDVAAVLRQSTVASSKDYMLLEPGRVVYATLVVYSKSHIESRMHSSGLLIMRETDQLISESESSEVAKLGGRLSYAFASDEIKFFDETIADAVELSNIRVRDEGFIVIGQLSQQDLLVPYGSSAALDYREYVKDPDSSKSSSSRLLTKRIHSWLGTSFYVAPLSKGDVTGAIRIKAKFNVSLAWAEDVPQIVYWHAEQRKWFLAAESSCRGNSSIDWTSGTVSIDVCETWSDIDSGVSSNRSKRSDANAYLSQPTQFAVVKIDSKFQNTAPRVPDLLKFSMKEDDVLNVQLDYVDDEKDAVVFALVNGTDMGDVTLSPSGRLTFTPCLNCDGHTSIAYRITERDVPLGYPLNAVGVIRIDVTSVQDPPMLFFYTDEMTSPQVATDVPVSFTFEQNHANSTETLFWISVFDPDTGDTVKFLHEANVTNSFSFFSTPDEWLTNRKELLKNYSTISREIPSVNSSLLRYVADANFTGMDEIRILGYDENFAYTNLLTIRLYGLINPCTENGQCNGTNVTCADVNRAFSWDGYSCACFPGYTGVRCHIDIDECESSPCATGYDCTDRVNAFECAIKTSVIVGIVCAVVVFVAAIVTTIIFVVLYKRKRAKKMDIATREGADGAVPLENLGGKSTVDVIANPLYDLNTSREIDYTPAKAEQNVNSEAAYANVESQIDQGGRNVDSEGTYATVESEIDQKEQISNSETMYTNVEKEKVDALTEQNMDSEAIYSSVDEKDPSDGGNQATAPTELDDDEPLYDVAKVE